MCILCDETNAKDKINVAFNDINEIMNQASKIAIGKDDGDLEVLIAKMRELNEVAYQGLRDLMKSKMEMRHLSSPDADLDERRRRTTECPKFTKQMMGSLMDMLRKKGASDGMEEMMAEMMRP